MTIKQIKSLRDGVFSPINIQFANFICRIADSEDAGLYLAAALASHAVTESHICANLPELAGKKFPLEIEYPEQTQIQCPEWDEWKTILTSEKVSSVIAENGRKPLILDSDGRLYLQRYWQYEKKLAENLKKRAIAESLSLEKSNWLQQRLNQLFPNSDTDDTQPNWQKIAAFAALRSKLTIISGGPGTGKTTTVARILTLLLEDHAFSDRESRYRILVAAPTGKAAARLSESLRQAKNATELNADQNPNFNYLATTDTIRGNIPEEARTIHRLLRPIFGTPRFKYNQQNPLPADVLVVDEASMVALPLMAKLAAALPESARLILIGDMDQLASVEPGYVLGDICDAANIDSFPADFCTEYEHITGERLAESRDHLFPLAGTAIHLKHSHRFKSGSAIAKISRQINQAENRDTAKELLELMQTLPQESGFISRSIKTEPGSSRTIPQRSLRELILDNYGDFLNTRTPQAALAKLAQFRVLCALRRGGQGVERLNQIIEDILAFKYVSRDTETAPRRELNRLFPNEQFYDHRPIMIRQNDYSLNLFNGDIGVILTDAENNGSRQPLAYFQSTDNTTRCFNPNLLPDHETCFAMTVHKSQGSEFDKILFILPAQDTPVLSKELIYTGITRARKEVELWYDEAVLLTAVARRTQRSSGLREKLSS